MTKTTAKLFMHGRSQAVRLPKEFRMPGTEVEISRSGDLVTLKALEKTPKAQTDWDKFWSDMDDLGPTDELFPDNWRQQNMLPLEAKVKFN